MFSWGKPDLVTSALISGTAFISSNSSQEIVSPAGNDLTLNLSNISTTAAHSRYWE